MGKKLSPWIRLALGAVRMQKVLSQLALANQGVGRTLHLSLLTKALVARSYTNIASALTRRISAGPGPRRNSNYTNTGQQQSHPSLPVSPSPSPSFSGSSNKEPAAGILPVLDLIKPYLDLSPSTLNFFLPSPTYAMASYASYSTSSSDISTPRSISPSSVGRSSQSSISSSNKRMSISSSRRISAANPMSTVDIATIEEAMRMANLDTLRGYSQKSYGEVRQYATTEYVPENQALGYQVLSEPLWNKGKPRRHPKVPPSTSLQRSAPS